MTDAGPWSELEINRRLKALTDDVATIRRGFIDHGVMTRDAHGKAYARVDRAMEEGQVDEARAIAAETLAGTR